MPRIPKIIDMNRKKKTMFTSYGRDSSSELTSLLMLGTALILLRGLMTLRVLRDLRLGMFGNIDIQLIMTTAKSKIFHGSLM